MSEIPENALPCLREWVSNFFFLRQFSIGFKSFVIYVVFLSSALLTETVFSAIAGTDDKASAMILAGVDTITN